MDPTVSLLAEIPSHLHDGLQLYLENHPSWDFDKVMESAIALFLIQNGSSLDSETSQLHRKAVRTYLDNMVGGLNG